MMRDSCGPYRGGLAHMGGVSPVSTWNNAPLMCFRTPSSANTSQNFIIMASIRGRKLSGQSAHWILSVNSCWCFSFSNFIKSVRGGNSDLLVHNGFPYSLYRISKSLSGSGMQSGSLYLLATWGRHALLGGCTGLVLSFLVFASAISCVVAADAANETTLCVFMSGRVLL